MARFDTIAKATLIDEPVHIRLLDLEPATQVTIRAEFCDDFGQTWASWAEFAADNRGTVDLALAKPFNGTYHDADMMGLFWSMKLNAEASQQPVPFPNTATKSLKPLSIKLTAQREAQIIATAVVERKFITDEVKRVDVRDDGLVATLFIPSHAATGPAVITLGGSGGGFGWSHQVAALLASRGCTTMAVAYFDWRGEHGLPNQLVEIPLEYVGKAIERLLRLVKKAGDLVVIGYSKGAELALALAATYSEINRVVAYVPSSVVWHGYTMPDPVAKSTWSYQGQPLPFLSFANGYFDEAGWQDQEVVAKASVPVERITGSILLISATNDGVWPSAKMADMVVQRLEQYGHTTEIKHLRLSGAGHNLSVPLLPAVAFDKAEIAVNARAEREAWREVLHFLELEKKMAC